MSTVKNSKPATKNARLEARVSKNQKALFERAAHYSGCTLSEFVIRSVEETALQTVREQELLSLTGEDREAFLEALRNEPDPSPRLQEAAKRHTKHNI